MNNTKGPISNQSRESDQPDLTNRDVPQSAGQADTQRTDRDSRDSGDGSQKLPSD